MTFVRRLHSERRCRTAHSKLNFLSSVSRAEVLHSLYSFGKYLELLLYSPALCSISPWLCEHTTPPPHPWPTGNSPPTSRFNIVRIFEFGKREVRFRTSLSPTLFDVRIPLLQILRGRYSESSLSKSAKLANKISISTRKSDDSDDEKIALRKEIKQWWQGVSDHLDKLVCYSELLFCNT